jgi:DNA modification methylase
VTVTVHHGDSREVLKTLADASIDSVVCDPPYALVSIGKRFGADNAAPAKVGKSGAYARASAGFMGKKWDTGETAFDPAFWVEVMRVLKPGGHLIAASGTRTYHRLACAVEDAGFEIRDMISWLYGSGFPKSHDVAKGIDKIHGAKGEFVATAAPVKRMIPGADQHKGGWEKTNGREYTPGRTEAATDAAKAWGGWGTALKPACEPWVLARKPLDGSVAGNVLEHGTGALNVDGCRIQTTDSLGGGAEKETTSEQKGNEGWARPWMDDPAAREAHAARVRANVDKAQARGRWPANVVHDGSDEVVQAFPAQESGGTPAHRNADKFRTTYGDFKGGPVEQGIGGSAGSAARFFYSAKADVEDRHGSKHPTVKPVDLMAWLVRLVTPPGGTVLDPFAGTGTTGLAAMREGCDCILIEREAEYVADIERRIAWANGEGRLTVLEQARDICPEAAAGLDMPLFGGEAA